MFSKGTELSTHKRGIFEEKKKAGDLTCHNRAKWVMKYRDPENVVRISCMFLEEGWDKRLVLFERTAVNGKKGEGKKHNPKIKSK